jgi:hypothetical protein
MWIICVYTLIVLVGEAMVMGFGLYLDRVLPAFSLSISLTLFFAILWFGWSAAVWWTEPKHQARAAAAKS